MENQTCQSCKDIGIKQTLPITLICGLCKRGYCTHCHSDCDENYANDTHKMIDGILNTGELGCDNCE